MQQDYLLDSYDFELPESLIAQSPALVRDESKLMVLNRKSDVTGHHIFSDITGFFKPGDALIVNNTKVFPARFYGTKETGGKVEIFLLQYPVVTSSPKDKVQKATTSVLLKSSKRAKPGSKITLSDSFTCMVVTCHDHGKAEVELHYPNTQDLDYLLQNNGQVPLPPYINRPGGTTEDDRIRYQTVYANQPGAVAAPTAGLHFTDNILKSLSQMGVKMSSVLLHVGYGTFAPVRTENILLHEIHSEYVEVTKDTVDLINKTKDNGGRVWAVGTTTVRALESAAVKTGVVTPMAGECDLYITPGFKFHVVDKMITNFHLPKSSLLFLVSAFFGREKLLSAYREAISRNYRFFSYGDSMVIL